MSSFYGTKVGWLNSKVYIVQDIMDDEFATNFETETIKERINRGIVVQEPKFLTLQPSVSDDDLPLWVKKCKIVLGKFNLYKV